MPEFIDGLGTDYLALRDKKVPTPPEDGVGERLLYHLMGLPNNVITGLNASLNTMTGQPQFVPPELTPEARLAPAQGLGQSAVDLLVGGLLPAGIQIAGTGGAVRGLMGKAATLANSVGTRALSDAAAFSLLGSQESTPIGLEQGIEGAAYGGLTALPRLKRVLPAAILAALSKGFFDYDGGDKIVGDFTRGDINAIAGFGTAFLPGIGAVKQPKYLGPESLDNVPPSGHARDLLQLRYTPPSQRVPGWDDIEGEFTRDVPLLSIGRADNRFAPITDFNAPQTEAQILNRIPARKDVINMPGGMAGPPTPGVATAFDQLSLEAQMQSPQFAMLAKLAAQHPLAAMGYTPTVTGGGLDDILTQAMVRKTAEEKALEKFIAATNPERSINPQLSRVRESPEFRTSEGGFISQEGMKQLAKAGFRGIATGSFGGAAAALDEDPNTDPRTAFALAAALGVAGPGAVRAIMDQIQMIKKVRNLGSEAGSIPAGGQIGQSNLDASVKKNMDDALMMNGNDPKKAADWLDKYASALQAKGETLAADNFKKASIELKKNLASSGDLELPEPLPPGVNFVKEAKLKHGAEPDEGWTQSEIDLFKDNAIWLAEKHGFKWIGGDKGGWLPDLKFQHPNTGVIVSYNAAEEDIKHLVGELQFAKKSPASPLKVHGAMDDELHVDPSAYHTALKMAKDHGLKFIKFNMGADDDIVWEFKHKKTGQTVAYIGGDAISTLKYDVGRLDEYVKDKKSLENAYDVFQEEAPGWHVSGGQVISPDGKLMGYSQAVEPEPYGRNFPDVAIATAKLIEHLETKVQSAEKFIDKEEAGFKAYTNQFPDDPDEVLNLKPQKVPAWVKDAKDREAAKNAVKAYKSADPTVLAEANEFAREFKPLQSLQKDTPAFKEWFGDSQAVNEKGEPKPFYHGTQKGREFNEFRGDRHGFISLAENPEFSSQWIGVSSGKPVSREIAAQELKAAEAMGGKARMFKVYVRAPKIWDYRNPDHVAQMKAWLVKALNSAPDSLSVTERLKEVSDGNWAIIESYADQIRLAKYDAFYTTEGHAKTFSRNLHVFNPNNIKSATGNSGAFKLGNPDIRGFVMLEMSQAMSRATLGALVGSFAGGMTDDPDERQGMVIGGLIGAGAFLFGPAVAISMIGALARVKVPKPSAGKTSTMKDWMNMIKTLNQTIEENAGATITRGSTRIADRLARVLSRNLELHLPEQVKSKLLEAKGLGSLFLDQIDSAILKVALRYNPDDVVKGIANQYLDGKIDSAAFLQQLQPHIITTPQIANYAKFMVAGREAVNGLQRMLVSGIGDQKMRNIINDSIGKYLTRSYRLFTDKAWMPEESSITNLVAEIHQKQAFGPGASIEDIENALRQYVREVKTNKGVYGVSNFDAGTKINQQILKERKDMSDGWRRFLGEITDPTERIYQTVFRLRPMAEASKYFNSLIKLEADGLPQAFRNYAEKEAFRSNLLQQLQSPSLSDADKAVINQKIQRLAAYQNVEAHPKFGAVQGHIVSLPVWDTLQTFDSATNTFNHPFFRSLSNVHTQIKLGRTAFNPMTIIRNMVTTPAFMVIARTNTKDIAEAWHVIHQENHVLRSEILKQGIMNVDQMKTEFYKEYQNITGTKFNFGTVDLANLGLGTYDLDIAEKAGRRGVRSLLDFYRLPDNVVRIAGYLSAKRRIGQAMGKGMDDLEVISKATEFTNRYTMNYDAVAPIIKHARQLPFTNLFISYTAEMARISKNLVMDVIEGQKGNLARHDRMYAAFPLAALAILPEMLQWSSESSLSKKDREDWDKVKRLLPDYSRTRYRAGIQRDPKTGQFRYIDFTPLIASDSFNQLVKAVSTGDWEAAKAVNPIASWDNTPALNIVAEQIAGKDKRTFREFRGNMDRVAAVAKEVLPPWMPGGFEWTRARQAHGLTESGERGITNQKTGVRLTPSDFWTTYFGPLAGQLVPPGAKVGSVDLGVLERRITQEIKNEVANETAYLNDVLKSDVKDEVKARAAERFRVSIATLQENYRSRLGVRER